MPWMIEAAPVRPRQYLVVSPDSAGSWHVAVTETDQVCGPYETRTAALEEARRRADPDRQCEIHVLDQNTTLLTVLTCAARPRWHATFGELAS
jgi:hypothetical protein